MNNLFQAYKLKATLKILGICFGHQLIGQFHQAKVEKFDRAGGIEEINFNQEIIK